MFSWKFNSHADSVGVSGGMLFSNFVCIMLSRFQTSTFALHVCDGLFSLNSKYCRFDHLAQIIRHMLPILEISVTPSAQSSTSSQPRLMTRKYHEYQDAAACLLCFSRLSADLVK